MEQQSKSSFSRLMSILFIAMGIFLGIYAFFAHATNWTINGNTWDNANYLTSGFWSYGPSSGDIITALYGSGDEGSAYTQNWSGYNSGSCLSGGMNVEYTGNLSLTTLADNTIYVVTGSISTGNTLITLGNCSAVISNQSKGTTFHSTVQITKMFYGDLKKYVILDNININGTGGGVVPAHAANTYGIYSRGDTNLLSLNNIQVYNNASNGIYMYSSSNNSISNTQAYNNTNGIFLNGSSNCSINNIQAYNNNNYGIYMNNSSNSIINNIQTYNNTNGIYLSISSNNLLNSIQSYNNGIGIYLNSTSTGNQYYSTGYIFGNGFDIGGSGQNLTGGTGIYYSTLGRTTGQMVTGGTMSWNYITNPQNASGNYLLDWNNSFSSITGYQVWSGIVPILYSLGGMISRQQQPVLYSGSALITGGVFDATKFIGTQITYLSGSIVISGGAYSSTSGITVLLASATTVQYRIFGDIVSETTGTLSTSLQTGVVLSGSDGLKNIFVQFSTGNDRATHYRTTITLDTTAPTLSGVTPDEYYTGDLTITGYDNIAFSGFQLSGTFYTGSSLTVTGEGVRIITGYDEAGNTVNMTFTIDKTAPTLSGVTSGAYYNTGITITGNDNITFYRFQLSGTYFPGFSLTVTGAGLRVLTGYDKAGNTTGVTFTIDKTYPVFTGTTLGSSTSGNVVSGGYYNTGITITFFDNNGLSGATLSGNWYTGGTLITGNGNYIFTVTDLAGNSTGMTFWIDTISPTLTGAAYLGHYNTNVIITGLDNFAFSGFQLSGTFYTGSSLTVTGEGVRILTGYDKAGNTIGTIFSIDKTYPVFTGTTLGSPTSGNVVSGGYYNTGITITFFDNSISGAILSGLNGNAYLNTGYVSGTTITTGGTYKFTVYDTAGNSTGMTFTIDRTNPLVTGIYPYSGLNYTGGSNIAFIRSGFDNAAISGYTLYVSGSSYPTASTGYTVNGMSNGTYAWYVIITDRAGNTGVSASIPFSITTPLLPTMTMLTGNLQYNVARYSKDYVSIYLRTNKVADYVFTGDFYNPTPPLINTLNGGMTGSFYLSGTDAVKNIYLQVTDGTTTTGTTFTVRLDTTVPTLPTLTIPASGGTASGAFTLNRSSSSDAGAGLSGYQYFVSSTGIYGGVVVKSGFTTSTSVAVANGELGVDGTYYRYVKAIDRLGNSGATATQRFNYSGILDTVPNTFSFNHITDATIDHVYASNTITIAGLSANTPVLANINRGALYISGNMVGTTGYVQNGRTVKIELTSSDEYDDDVTSTLTIGGVSATFTITTETEEEADNGTDYEDIETDLSNTEKLQIIAIFEVLKDLYAGDKEQEFFNTLMVMLENKMDDYSEGDAEYDALKYLYDLAEQYYEGGGGSSNTDIENTPRIINGVYTAPNGKRYPITYDSVKRQFTSSNFITPKYFPTLDVLKYTIDIYNPGGSQYLNGRYIIARWGRIFIDGTRQTSAYTAPNHKVYYFFKTIEGQFSSYTFTVEKYFDSLNTVKEYVYNSNR